MNELVAVLVLAGVAAAVWCCTKPPAVFVVRICNGTPEATHGRVTGAFLGAIADVCRDCGISSGDVWGVARGRRISLRFSAHFPAAARQRLRNWWALSGWSASRTARPPRSRGR